ncbi:hypothetical protein LV779_39725 [Streptomyces thinghirensis]|nr:hypothetical protein [Streptomyces thinghirensis]
MSGNHARAGVLRRPRRRLGQPVPRRRPRLRRGRRAGPCGRITCSTQGCGTGQARNTPCGRPWTVGPGRQADLTPAASRPPYGPEGPRRPLAADRRRRCRCGRGRSTPCFRGGPRGSLPARSRREPGE